jgi:hypothetical protein
MTYQIIRTLAEEKDTISPKPAIHENSDQISENSPTIKKISKKQLINKINYLNFQDETIIVNFRHKKYNNIVSYQALPEPCLGEELICKWVNPEEVKNRLKTCEVESLQIKHEYWNLLSQLELLEMNTKGLRLRIPDIYFLTKIENYNYPCNNIKAQLIHNSVLFSGDLIKFCQKSFSIKIDIKPPQTSQWINSNLYVNLLLSNDIMMLYSGKCAILEATSKNNSVFILLEPKNIELPRFKPKKFRSIREKLIPSPTVVFKHPFTDKWYDLKVVNLSGSGLSIDEKENSAVLIPGLILPQVEMQFATSFKVKFTAQVVYQHSFKNELDDIILRCGLVIIDITLNSHKNLMGFLHQARDENMYIGKTKKMDELWDFFFQSGFIYPKKFSHIQRNKHLIKETYEKLYLKNSNITRHFICKEDGQIRAHMSSIRFYENAWMIHHHASRKSSFKGGGISVLNQIGRFINDSHRLHSAKMDYVFCYFRETNKFPSRVFGGAARNIQNPLACSLDSFAYLHFKTTPNMRKIPWTFELTKTENEDLDELKAFYEYQSGGLMLHALNLFSQTADISKLTNEFNKIGLKRDRHLFSLKKNNVLKAVILVNISNFGLNLSDLTNCLTVLVLDPIELPFNIIADVSNLISEKLLMENSPMMIYPVEYLHNQKEEFDHIYNLWILNTENTDNYFRYLKRLLKFIQH